MRGTSKENSWKENYIKKTSPKPNSECLDMRYQFTGWRLCRSYYESRDALKDSSYHSPAHSFPYPKRGLTRNCHICFQFSNQCNNPKLRFRPRRKSPQWKNRPTVPAGLTVVEPMTHPREWQTVKLLQLGQSADDDEPMRTLNARSGGRRLRRQLAWTAKSVGRKLQR